MVITRGLGAKQRVVDRKDMEKIVKQIIDAINNKIKEKGWDHRELAKRLERPGDEDLTKEEEEKRVKRNEVWLSRKIGKKTKTTRKITVDDLHIIARALDVHSTDFFPKRLEDEICSLPLTEFIRNVCRNEIKHYLKENGIITIE